MHSPEDLDACFKQKSTDATTIEAHHAQSVRASYAAEVLATDAIAAYFQVLHQPMVAVRAGKSVDAALIGARSHGEYVAATQIHSNWAKLLTTDPGIDHQSNVESQHYMLIDATGTKVAHLGRLLKEVPLLGPVAVEIDHQQALLVSPPPLRSPLGLGVGGGVGGAGGGLSLFLLLLSSSSEFNESADALAKATCALCAGSAMALVLRQREGVVMDDSWPNAHEARSTLRYASSASNSPQLQTPITGSLPPRLVVSGCGDREAAAALSLASVLATDAEATDTEMRAAGAWLRLSGGGGSSNGGSNGGSNATAMIGAADIGDGLPCWGEAQRVAWTAARAAAAQAGPRLAVLVTGGAYARQLANWLCAGGVSQVAMCSRAAARAAERGVRHEEWMEAHGTPCGVDRSSLWLAVKWSLGLPLPLLGRSGEEVGCSLDGIVLALGQLQPKPGSVGGDWLHGGIIALNAAASNATRQGASLLVAPECFLQGYETLFNAAEEAAVARSEAAARVGAIARRHKIGILCGYIERRGDAIFNSAVLIGPGGDLVHHHRKCNLTEEERKCGHITPGTIARAPLRQAAPPVSGNVVDLNEAKSAEIGAAAVDADKLGDLDGPCSAPLAWLGGARVGVLICADIEVPDGADAAVAAGADLLLVVACTYVPTLHEMRTATRKGTGIEANPAWLGAVAHAVKHSTFVAWCNQAKGMGVLKPKDTSGAGVAEPRTPEVLSNGADAEDERGNSPADKQKAAWDILSSATCQGGSSRVLAPDGRDVVFIPEDVLEGMAYAVLGKSAKYRIAWRGSVLADTVEHVGVVQPTPAVNKSL